MNTRMEKIISIEEVENVSLGESWYSADGYAVTTDKQVIKLLIDNGQCCCENWGYFMSEDDFSEFIGAGIQSITLTDTALKTKGILPEGDDYHEGDVMFVNINTTNGTLQFVAYNEHNGYYGHGAYVISEQLNHAITL